MAKEQHHQLLAVISASHLDEVVPSKPVKVLTFVPQPVPAHKKG